MNIKIIWVFVFVIFVGVSFPNLVFAHPGNTAVDGCHYCRTNCDKWGVAWNERHCHNGGSAPAVQKAAPIVATKTPTKVPAPTTKIVVPTKKPTARPTSELIKTPIPSATEKITPSIIPTVQPTETMSLSNSPIKQKSFLHRLFSFLFD